ncbi:MAG: DUF3332 family protein [Planctomycetes bacterium]|nr:DUF3332 family protein [Planctomycetota bacterium]
MRKTALALVLLSCTTFAGCLAGPKQLERSVSDWDNKTYVQSPWLNNFMHVFLIFTAMELVAKIGDTLIINPFVFWTDDAWGCHGTGFVHNTPELKDGAMHSLLMDDSALMRIHK